MSRRDSMEERLLRIRQIALERGVVEPRSEEGDSPARASGETGYYGTPVVKRPVWTWEVPLYFFVGGSAGGCAVIGEMARLSGADPHLVSRSRYLALSGAALSAPLLISDLGRPDRFIFMLRVFKRQSPMSVGVWTLVGFSALTALTSVLSLTEGRKRGAIRRLLEALFGPLSALFGAAMSSYTGVLIGATAIPVWNRNVGRLPIIFAMSGLASAASVLELSGRTDRSLNRIAGGAALVETAIDTGSLLDGNVEREEGRLKLAASLLSGPVPLVLRIVGGRSKRVRRLAALSQIAGSLLTRYDWVERGRRSADESSAVHAS